jgi:hypothetical protein
VSIFANKQKPHSSPCEAPAKKKAWDGGEAFFCLGVSAIQFYVFLFASSIVVLACIDSSALFTFKCEGVDLTFVSAFC